MLQSYLKLISLMVEAVPEVRKFVAFSPKPLAKDIGNACCCGAVLHHGASSFASYAYSVIVLILRNSKLKPLRGHYVQIFIELLGLYHFRLQHAHQCSGVALLALANAQ